MLSLLSMDKSLNDVFFMEQLIATGVDQETAEQDACRIEHAISDTSFRKLKEKVQGTD